MYHICICDDNPSCLTLVKLQLSQMEQSTRFQISSFSDAQELLGADPDWDIAILDICLGEASGIDLANALAQKSRTCQVIFISDFLENAPLVYDAPHVYFVLKSQLQERLPKALERAITELEQNRSLFLTISTTAGRQVLPQETIVYMERNLRVTHIHTLSETWTTSEKLSDLQSRLSSDLFCCCHSSFLVNLGMVRSLAASALVLQDGTRLPISRGMAPETKRAFAAYWSRH